MVRRIIKINEEKCNGCSLCANACHEGAITMKNGKAQLIRDDYCDGLGDCLPVCPMGAITFEEREALAYDEAAVQERLKGEKIERKSQLMQWPVQIKLVPIEAAYFENADLLIAADCTAYAYDRYHEDFMKNHVTLIGCPKLDTGDYSEKLAEILKQNSVKSIKVVKMEVPCCGGMERAVKTALNNSGKIIPCQVVTLPIRS